MPTKSFPIPSAFGITMRLRRNLSMQIALIILTGWFFVTPVTSFAQSSEGSSAAGLEEVIVTATRRAEGVQDVGVSVTAYSGEDLRDRNITTSADIANQTPGLSLIQAGGAPLAGLIAIRGVAQNDFAAHLESSNVVYIDNTYRHSNGGNLSNLFDVERVEVLRGPQGTLFGRNATGGLVHILSNQVEDEFGGYADLTLGAFGQVRGEGAINAPLSDNLGIRVSGVSSKNDGFIENDIGPDQIIDDSIALRAQALFTPNDELRVRVQGEWRDADFDAAGGAFPTGGFVGVDGLGQFRDAPNNFNDAGYIDADGDPFTGSFDAPGFFRREEINAFVDVQYEFEEFTLTSITSYNEIDTAYEEDNVFSHAWVLG